MTCNEYYTTGQTASILKISPGTLQNWRSQSTSGEPIGPRFIKHRRNVYYSRVAIERYKAENFIEYNSTEDWKRDRCGN